MAMKKCKECGNEISSSAKICPSCGKDNRIFLVKHKVLSYIIILCIIVIIGALASSNNNNNTDSTITSVNTTESNKNTSIAMGDIVTEKDWEFSIEDTYFGQRINPPTQPSFYNYYQVDDTNNTYLCIVLNAKNISTVELKADDFANVKVKYNNNYTYSSFSVSPDKNLGFTYSNITSIKPLTSDKVYFLVEMPNSVSTETDTPISIEIKVNNTTYYYQYR